MWRNTIVFFISTNSASVAGIRNARFATVESDRQSSDEANSEVESHVERMLGVEGLGEIDELHFGFRGVDLESVVLYAARERAAGPAAGRRRGAARQ